MRGIFIYNVIVMEENLFVIGEIIAKWGVKGEVKINVITDFPKRFKKGGTFLIDGTRYTIEWAKTLNNAMVLKIEGIDTPEDAEKYKGKKLFITEAELHKLPKGKYYRHQIIGLKVVSQNGEPVGEVTEIIETPANKVYVVSSGDREALVPDKGDFVKNIDIDAKTMTIEVVPGMFNK